ncbi:MAG: hemolysin family protein [Verrucomicrobiota bacterium]
MTILLIYVAVALGFSFLCSLLEATLLTITPSQLEAAKTEGRRWALNLQDLKRDIDRPLSAILTLNTIAHTMGATGAGAQYVRVYGDATGGIFAAALTLAVLILTEIIPKTLGARYVLFFAPFTAAFLPILETLLRPVVWFCQVITRLITCGRASEPPRFREEILAVTRLGVEQGTVKDTERRIVRNMLNLNVLKIASIMTPRPVIFCLPESLSLEEFAERVNDKHFSRIPVYGDSVEQITGFVLSVELLRAFLQKERGNIGDFKRELLFVPESMKIDVLFERLTTEQAHIAMVQDEYGSSVGLVTLEDVVETLVGIEIVDEQDEFEDMQQHARDLWKQRAKKMGIQSKE